MQAELPITKLRIPLRNLSANLQALRIPNTRTLRALRFWSKCPPPLAIQRSVAHAWLVVILPLSA